MSPKEHVINVRTRRLVAARASLFNIFMSATCMSFSTAAGGQTQQFHEIEEIAERFNIQHPRTYSSVRHRSHAATF